MKILHTSDWHLGHRLLEQSQYEEQFRFLKWLEEYINDQRVDLLLIAGDIFDTGVPSTQSQKMYYDFLVNLKKTPCQQIIITGGNHDAPGTINAPKELLQSLSIHVVGKATDQIEDEVFTLKINGELVIIAAVPYLRDQDIRRALAGESFDQIGDRYKVALINHYNEIAAYCETLKSEDSPVFAMGHLFAIGAMTSESEETIYVGNLGDIHAADFPDLFYYVALGHLHRAQMVAGAAHIRYSGSPYPLSFSEAGNIKKVVAIDILKGKIGRISEVAIPKFRELHRISGSLESCIAQLHELDQEKHELTPWVEVILDNATNTKIGFGEISKTAESLDLEVLKVTLKNEREIAGLEKLIENAQHIADLSPIDVFKLKCREQNFNLEENSEILDAFHEILQMAKER